MGGGLGDIGEVQGIEHGEGGSGGPRGGGDEDGALRRGGRGVRGENVRLKIGGG